MSWEPLPGERLLEVGPGTGYYALPVASWLAPHGRLDVGDLPQEMVDPTPRRAAHHGTAKTGPPPPDGWTSSTSSRRCSTTPSAAPPNRASTTSSAPVPTHARCRTRPTAS